MASQLYESVMANDAKRDALKKKKEDEDKPDTKKDEAPKKAFVNTRGGNRARKLPPRVDVLGKIEEGRKAVKGAILKNFGIGEPAAKGDGPRKAAPKPAAATAQAASGPAASVAAKSPSAATKSYPLPQSGQAKPESVKSHTGRPQSGQAKPESVSPRKASNKSVSSKPKRAKGSIGAASNRELPGRTTITYRSGANAPAATTDKPSNYGTTTNKPPASDRAARIAKAVAAAKSHSVSDYRKGGAAARSRAMNRND